MSVVQYAVGWLGRFAPFQAVVEIAVADRAQRLVIEAGRASGGMQLFCKGMQRAQTISGCGKLSATGAEEFLIAVINQRGVFTGNNAAGMASAGYGTVGSA